MNLPLPPALAEALARMAPHYPTRGERLADAWVHGVGIAFAAIGGLVLLGLSIFGRLGVAATVAVSVYAGCLLAMLIGSALYNFAKGERQQLFRRFDHAGIFLMIAGTYTPFTTLVLKGGWSIGMTTAVWTLAAAGALGKLFLPGLGKKLWVALYVALGWLIVIAIRPLADGVSLAALVLIAVGGLVYSTGVLVYLRKTLRFRRAVWHGFVVAAAAVHYAAVMTAVVFAPAS
ncbi:hemolysin III family protein [Caulobacter sp. 17J65-9]|uniref:PAQR family membrane homeostasis protein TrhA n=1 Tax=Caulobacter sp. 17J65-9 TaxID=2709382 RepID=UPI00320473AF